MEIRDKNEFLRHLDDIQNNDQFKSEYFNSTHFLSINDADSSAVIDNEDFKLVDLSNLYFEGFDFFNCKFDKSFLNETTFLACGFYNCSFNNLRVNEIKFFECEFENSTFENSVMSYIMFNDSVLKNIHFNDCKELLELYFGNCQFSNLIFKNVYIAHSRFYNLDFQRNNENIKISFERSVLDHNQYLDFNLTDTIFRHCILGRTTFSNCILVENTFDNSNSSKSREYSFIDFQTIIKSEPIDSAVLENCFGINESIIKNKVTDMVSKIEYQTVFISYSFKDKDFANQLNDSLRKKGVVTFLWEKDASLGKGLKKIMKENIKKQDRLLFIASANSLKSKACQFELSEGRKKQDSLWQEILFPILLDNFLFEVEKEDIRPIDSQEEYWLNIIELKEINSIDFSKIESKRTGEQEFEDKVLELVRALKK